MCSLTIPPWLGAHMCALLMWDEIEIDGFIDGHSLADQSWSHSNGVLARPKQIKYFVRIQLCSGMGNHSNVFVC